MDTESIVLEKVRDAYKTFIGYPLNLGYDYTPVFDKFKYAMNNIGCPFSRSTLKISSKEIELKVLDFFADLWGICKTNIWGYLTSSGTEGNFQGLYVGREVLGNVPVFYTSKESHYSIFKIARLLQLELCVIDTLESGEMDYRDFEHKLMQNINRPALINANLGTTMKSAIDNTREIYRVLKKHNKHHEYYLHADGALMGFVLPFLENDLFFKNHIHSISISGHKFLGIPYPCGVFLMEKQFLTRISNAVEYIGTIDCTISGSRNGQTPFFFKHIIDAKGKEGFKKDVACCIALAEYLTERLPSAWRNQNSLTVVFPKPSEEIITKWQLATSNDISHVVVLPHVTTQMIDEFIEDILQNQT